MFLAHSAAFRVVLFCLENKVKINPEFKIRFICFKAFYYHKYRRNTWTKSYPTEMNVFLKESKKLASLLVTFGILLSSLIISNFL